MVRIPHTFLTRASSPCIKHPQCVNWSLVSFGSGDHSEGGNVAGGGGTGLSHCIPGTGLSHVAQTRCLHVPSCERTPFSEMPGE